MGGGPGPESVGAQLARIGLSDLGLGDHVAATARGVAAIAANPAALGLEGGASAAVLPLRVSAGMGPVSLGDLAEYGGRVLPDAVRRDWLRRVRAEGRQSGGGEAWLTPAAVVSRGVGLQLSTVAVVRARLNPDAAELVLFGNAGLDGTPRDLRLGDSRLEGAVVSTVAVGRGLGVGRVAGGRLRLGATLTWSVGHAVLAARDAGSAFRPEPFEAGLRFPVVLQEEGAGATVGSGLGVDLGALWLGRGLRVGLSVTNVVQGFRWRVDRLAFRPGTALFDDETSESDFDERPLEEAPTDLVRDARNLTFARVASAGVAVEPTDDLLLVAGVRHRFGDGLDPGPASRLGVGAEALPLEWLPVRAHLSWVTGGLQGGGGAGLRLGSWEVSGAAAYRHADDRATWIWSLGVGLGLGAPAADRSNGPEGSGA